MLRHTVRLTIARNAVLERIVDAGSDARILDCVMACISICFIRSFDIIFPGRGLVKCCQHVTGYPHEVEHVCDELAQLVVNSVDAQYQLTL
jgi:hypothetical protein